MKQEPARQATAFQILPSYLKKGAYVRITKIRAMVGGVPPCPRQIYEPGLWTNVLSLPIDYWMEGLLEANVVKNGLIRLERRVRDGVVKDGFFISTRIYSVQGDKVRTFNSLYQIEAVGPFIPGLRS